MIQTTRSDINRQPAPAPKWLVPRRLCTLLPAAALLLLPAARAEAAAYTLLTLQQLRQFVSTSYNYHDSLSDYDRNKSKSTLHGFSEAYSIGADYSILHRGILNGGFEVSFAANQELSDDSRSGHASTGDNRIEYGVNGSALHRSQIPISFGLNSAVATVRPPFGRTYTVDSQNQHLAWSIRNSLLPVVLTINRSTSATAGTENDTESQSRSVQLSLNNSVGDLSNASLSLGVSSNQQTLLDSATSDLYKDGWLDLSHTLSWHNQRDLRRRLETKYLYRERSGDNSGTQQDLTSQLGWEVGKALNTNLSYSQGRNEDQNGAGSDSQGIAGSLVHQYLNCLYTSLGASMAKGSYSDGTDVTTAWNMALRYSNKLPKDSQMSLGYTYRYVQQDRERTQITLNEFETVEPGEIFPQLIDLMRENIDSSTIRIFLDAGRTLPFTDFSVSFTGVTTRLRLNSDPGVQFLHLSYSYSQSPDMKFATTGQGVSGSLHLFKGKHALKGSYSWTEKELLRGSDPSSTLDGSSQLRFGWESNLNPHVVSLDYASITSGSQDVQSMEAKWVHTYQQRDSSLRSEANDSYSWYASNGAGGSRGWDNTLKLSSSYSRSLIRNFKGRFTLGYFNFMNQETSSNSFNLSAGMDGNYGKTTISLHASGNLGVSSAGYTRNQSLTLSIRRMF